MAGKEQYNRESLHEKKGPLCRCYCNSSCRLTKSKAVHPHAGKGTAKEIQPWKIPNGLEYNNKYNSYMAV
jgi:hypothetical protein